MNGAMDRTNEAGGEYVCGECGRRFGDRESLVRHYRDIGLVE